MSQHEWVETSRKPLPCPCCANLNKRPKQIPVLILHLVKKLSASISRLGSYVGYLAGVCRPRCASVWQSVQQHSRTGPQPGSIFHPRNVGIHARGNRVVNCSSSGHGLRRAQTKRKNVIGKLQPQARAHEKKKIRHLTLPPPPREGCEKSFFFNIFSYRLSQAFFWLSPSPLRVLACGGVHGTTCKQDLVTRKV